MKRTIASLAILLLMAGTSVVRSDERHVKIDLKTINDSGVSGFVILTQLPQGGTNVNVVATGLQAGATYSSFYYESSDCSEPADLLKTFTAGDDGNGHVQGKIDDDLDEVGSVSVRLGPGYGTLLACAAIHD
jgi:hypothetical protein